MVVQSLSESESAHLLLFGLVPGVGQVRLRKLVEWTIAHDTTLGEVWSEGFFPSEIATIENIAVEIKKIKNEYTAGEYSKWLIAQNIRVLFCWQSEYPYWLKQLDQPPIVLFCQGNVSILQSSLPVAVVGSRALTAYGRQATKHLTMQLVESGACIVSGFMYGVDTVAHQTAIEQGGTTIAVLGYGHLQSFPRTHLALREAWLATERAVFLSPFWPLAPATQANFPIRNAIVAGLSLATVVTEAAIHSGSHITAERALEYNRVVCAVPGPITNPNSEGTKWLINQGGCLVSSGQDVVAEIGESQLAPVGMVVQVSQTGSQVSVPNFRYAGLSEDEIELYRLLQSGQLTFDQILTECALPPSEISQILSRLELKGKIECTGEEYIVLL